MAFTFGFYNSIDHDRLYNAEQMSSIFDGLIEDGVFETIGELFAVVPAGGMQINVKTGKAWFNHTWNVNDAWIPLFVPPADVVMDRYDAVVIDVDSRDNVRTNSIKIVQGVPSLNPVKPTLANMDKWHQHPIAYIKVKASTEEITAQNIEITVGTSVCPFVTGPLETVPIDDLFSRWEAEFDTWFDHIQTVLNDDVVTNLQNQINQLNANKVNKSDKAAESQLVSTNDTNWVTPKGVSSLVKKEAGFLKDVSDRTYKMTSSINPYALYPLTASLSSAKMTVSYKVGNGDMVISTYSSDKGTYLEFLYLGADGITMNKASYGLTWTIVGPIKSFSAVPNTNWLLFSKSNMGSETSSVIYKLTGVMQENISIGDLSTISIAKNTTESLVGVFARTSTNAYAVIVDVSNGSSSFRTGSVRLVEFNPTTMTATGVTIAKTFSYTSTSNNAQRCNNFCYITQGSASYFIASMYIAGTIDGVAYRGVYALVYSFLKGIWYIDATNGGINSTDSQAARATVIPMYDIAVACMYFSSIAVRISCSSSGIPVFDRVNNSALGASRTINLEIMPGFLGRILQGVAMFPYGNPVIYTWADSTYTTIVKSTGFQFASTNVYKDINTYGVVFAGESSMRLTSYPAIVLSGYEANIIYEATNKLILSTSPFANPSSRSGDAYGGHFSATNIAEFNNYWMILEVESYNTKIQFVYNRNSVPASFHLIG